jgi:ADP-ribosyl-[dinitrogen reductase] hydrolase
VSDHFRGCLLGLAVGDAVGTTAEFQRRGTFARVTGMVGGGPFNLNPGEWTDDTSMALCLATSLVEVGSFDAQDQMRRYCDWHERGYLSSTGYCFDIGNTVRKALYRYKETGDPFSGSSDPQSAGNGSIMRLAPVPMFYFPDCNLVVHYSVESSRTTHGAQECLDACHLLGEMLFRALDGADKHAILFESAAETLVSDNIRRIAAGDYRDKSENDIRGSGYVVNSLQAALWCFWTTESFEAAILKAANLGDDADTTAAICGQVAGAYYGEKGIPARWLEKLVMRDKIRNLADGLLAARNTNESIGS